MHLEVLSMAGKENFLVTYVYALNDETGRIPLWNDLKEITAMINAPWLILGDFNDILSVEERIGGKQRQARSGAFKECVESCGVEDVKYTGSFFTWNNKQEMNTRIYSKIDRVMANQIWLDKFPTAKVVFLPEGNFDHCLAVLSVYPDNIVGKKPFRYFRMWQNFPAFQEGLKGVWHIKGTNFPMFQLVQKLKRVKQLLKEMNKTEIWDIQAAHSIRYQELLDIQASLQPEHDT
ncbi:uncharacterized protein LOC133831962 [Humulus lupulus]|uniref:uncharacterized protein LOC133831962 n=1 Tax=Humulus lupulus TaxID=3486 RepID=UPI002B40C067|nr:uncharacterized protein LOC133831962 [Humulus lupulus]